MQLYIAISVIYLPAKAIKAATGDCTSKIIEANSERNSKGLQRSS